MENNITDNTQLTTKKELADILGITREGVMKKAKKEGWQFFYIDGVGRGGKEIRFDVASLPTEIREKVINHQKFAKKHLTYSDLTKKQKDQVDNFFNITGKYKEFENLPKNRRLSKIKIQTNFTKLFNEGKIDKGLLEANGSFVVRTLQNYLKKEREYRETNDLNCVVKRYGHNKGQTKLTKQDKAFINSVYLDENRRCIASIYRKYVIEQEKIGEKPLCYGSVYNYINLIDPIIKIRQREGKKALNDKAKRYISRDMELLNRNEKWVADGTVFDFYVLPDKYKNAPNNVKMDKLFKANVVAFIDMKTKKVTGWEISPTENGAAVVDALSYGILDNGKPQIVYCDNGKAFKNKWILGALMDDRKHSGMLHRLGIDVQYAQVKHPQSKGVVESFWRFVKEDFSKDVDSYCGIDNGKSPEELNQKLKSLVSNNRILTMQELYNAFGSWVKRYNNTHKHSGIGGMTPQQKWENCNNCGLVRVEAKDLLLATLYREEREVGRNGVLYMNWNYYPEDKDIMLIQKYLGKKVEIGIDRHDLKRLFVFDKTTGSLICIASREEKMSPRAIDAKNLEDFKEYKRIHKKINNAAKEITMAKVDLQEKLLKDTAISVKSVESGVLGIITPTSRGKLYRVELEETEIASTDGLAMLRSYKGDLKKLIDGESKENKKKEKREDYWEI